MLGARHRTRPPRTVDNSRVAVVRKRVVVHGRVQGVFFRDTIRRLADEHRVAGWVRNTWEGTVEAAFEGESDAVDALVAFCRDGPPGARVERVDAHDEAPEDAKGFRVSG
jgi:acylphosphatase